jgi:Holliday junction resolvase RusA-like endonuclease
MTTFTIPGKPFAWRRARSNGRIRFKDAATVAHADTLQALAAPHFKAPMEGPLRLIIVASFAIPKSWPLRQRSNAPGRPHAQKPDADNLAKQIGDGLNRIAWSDDSQIAEITVRKIWDATAQTTITIEAIE